MLDEIQSRRQQGPCLTAAGLQDTVRIDDLDADDRWPLYRKDALKLTPIRSILSYGMFRDGGTTAALNFYAEPVHAFDDESVNLGLIFATHTAMVWDMMRRDQQFRSALVSRDIIGQAKGRLMERFDIDADEAFRPAQADVPGIQYADNSDRPADCDRRSSAAAERCRADD